MRAFNRYARRGFTLVELMIVVAIIGILAALAIYGVTRYLKSAKTSEAKNNIGAIARGAVGAYERETTSSQVLTEGATSTAFNHDLCEGANAVPTSMDSVKGTKFQPSTVADDVQGYDTGDGLNSWRCLRFSVTSPTYFRYGYMAAPAGTVPAPTPAVTESTPAVTSPAITQATDAVRFLAFANGDLDGDGVYSGFGQAGAVNTSTKAVKLATQVSIAEEFE